ncbi:hypothetical protein MKX01_005437, partial [Papaver californicum]
MEIEPIFKQNFLGETCLKSDFDFGFSMGTCNDSNGMLQDIPKLDQFPVVSTPQPPTPPAPSPNYVNSPDHVFSNGYPIMHNFDVYEYKPYLEGGGSTNNSSTNINNGSLFHQNKGFSSYPLLTSRETTAMDQNHQICRPSALSFQEPDL